jgi:hypothetical protein
MKVKSEKRWYQIGLLSVKFPAVQAVIFTRISHYIDWINETIQNN